MNEEELLGGYEGIVTLPWSGLGAAETLKFHVFDIKAGDDEFYTILGGLEEYTNLIPDIEVEWNLNYNWVKTIKIIIKITTKIIIRWWLEKITVLLRVIGL